MTDLTPLEDDARALIERCSARGVRIATAESCTGGLVCGLLTEISGSSAVIDRGFVTYSNAAKTDLLGVSPDSIFDASWTSVINGTMVKVLSWYDNEYGYSCRTADLITKMAGL